MYMAIFTHTFCPIAPTKNSNKKGHFPHEIHAKNVLFTYSHQPDSLEMYFSNQPDNLYYPKNKMDATCKVQDNIHVFRLVHNMCPGFWVHINEILSAFNCSEMVI